MCCLNCCAAAPNAAYNSDPELLLVRKGGGACKASLCLGQSQERWRFQSSWVLKELLVFHPKEYLLVFQHPEWKELSALLGDVKSLLWICLFYHLNSALKDHLCRLPTSILSFAGRTPVFLECPMFCCWGASALGHGLTFLLLCIYVYKSLGHLKVVLEQNVLCVGGGKKRENIE